MRVCQFRHFGKWNAFESGDKECRRWKRQFLFYKAFWRPFKPRENANQSSRFFSAAAHANFAFMEIFAFNTFDTGQPFSAASAYF